MRLQILEDGFNPLQKIILGFIARASEGHIPGPVATFSYRRKFFGKEMARCVQEALREAKAWSTGEVELFAAFVSQLNRCKF